MNEGHDVLGGKRESNFYSVLDLIFETLERLTTIETTTDDQRKW